MSRQENSTHAPLLCKSDENGVNNWLRWEDLLYLHCMTGRNWFEIFLQVKIKLVV